MLCADLLLLGFAAALIRSSHAFIVQAPPLKRSGARRSALDRIIRVFQSTAAQDPSVSSPNERTHGDDFSIDFEDLVDALMDDIEEGDLDIGGDYSQALQIDEDDDKIAENSAFDESGEPTTEEEDLVGLLEVLLETPVGDTDIDDLIVMKESVQSILESLHSNSSPRIDEEVADTAEKLLCRFVGEWQNCLQENVSESKHLLLEPSDEDFLLVIQTWQALAGGDAEHLNTNALPKVIERVTNIFHLQQDLVRNGLEAAQPSSETFSTVLNVLASSRERGADRNVFRLFQDIPNKTVDMYATVIKSLAKSRDRGAANRAEGVLHEGVAAFPPVLVNGKPSGLTIDSFNVVLTAWAKSGLDYGPERAEKLIVFMDQTDTEHGSPGLIKPNIHSFTSLIDAHTQRNDWDGAAAAEKILRRLLGQYLDPVGTGEIPEPSVASWTICISGWARLSKKGFRGAASRAGKLLDWMESLHEEKKIGFGPDAIVYVSCMNAFAFSKTQDGPAKAEEILDHCYELYQEGDESMKPTIKSLRIVVESWIRSNATDAMEEAEILLERYEDMLDSSDVLSTEAMGDIRDIYRSMLFGFAKKDMPDEAQRYLQIMIDKGMKPDCFCYDKIIETNTLVNDPNAFARSYQVFEIMEEKRKIGEVNPNERVYTSFIRAMTKARLPRLPNKANVILRRMEDLYNQGNKGIQPTVFTYNAVLMACAEAPSTPDPQQMEAFKIAVKMFNDLRNSENEADHVTYGNMLRCAKLLPEGEQRDGVIKSTFSLCCQSGFVNDFVVRDLKSSASEDLWREVLRVPIGDDVDIELLPREWRYKFEKRKQKKPMY